MLKVSAARQRRANMVIVVIATSPGDGTLQRLRE